MRSAGAFVYWRDAFIVKGEKGPLEHPPSPISSPLIQVDQRLAGQ